jgi:hypothetical protein
VSGVLYARFVIVIWVTAPLPPDWHRCSSRLPMQLVGHR